MSTQDGGPAFARADCRYSAQGAQAGMSLRDYFAAKAMQGMLSGRGQIANEKGVLLKLPSEFAAEAYAIADAMLAERNK